jgi:uncharacterized membrane protein YbaN (DUF454 family)
MCGLNIWSLFGLLSLLLGGVGVVLPLLPTTPFVLLAAACFARSSPRMHQWLLRNEVFGPILREWENSKCISLPTKCLSLSMMLLVGGASIWFFVPGGWPRYAGFLLIGIGCLTVLSIKTCPRGKSRQKSDNSPLD